MLKCAPKKFLKTSGTIVSLLCGVSTAIWVILLMAPKPFLEMFKSYYERKSNLEFGEMSESELADVEKAILALHDNLTWSLLAALFVVIVFIIVIIAQAFQNLDPKAIFIFVFSVTSVPTNHFIVIQGMVSDGYLNIGEQDVGKYLDAIKGFKTLAELSEDDFEKLNKKLMASGQTTENISNGNAEKVQELVNKSVKKIFSNITCDLVLLSIFTPMGFTIFVTVVIIL
ncbi:MAG: hypothetical protein MHMPM18_000756 [Marteilia pararefringens]